MTLNRYITLEDVIELRTCYSGERLKRLAAGRKRVRLSTVLSMNIPAEDKVWLVTKFLPDSVNHKFARWCALQVVHLWDCSDVAWKYLETGNEDLRSTTWDVAWDVARSVAWDAARSVTLDAAWNAEYVAALNAAWGKQIEKLRGLIKGK